MRFTHLLLLRCASAAIMSWSPRVNHDSVPRARNLWRRGLCHLPPPPSVGVHEPVMPNRSHHLPPPHFGPSPPRFHHHHHPHPPPPHLRPPWPPDYRSWIYASSHPPPPPHCNKFTVLSYNILADYLAREHQSKLYFHIPRHVIDWAWRKRRLLIEFGLWAPDIMCLQEVDRFHDLKEELAIRGYNGIWKMRTGNAIDGCAIFWRANKFQLRHEEHIEFSRLGLRDNVAQICVLESMTRRPATVSQPASSRGANNVIICNIHVLYNPKRGEIKLGQVRVLLDRAYAISKTWNDAPVIVCGDFNCTPKSPLYNFVSQQKINFSGLARDQLSGQYSASIYKARPFAGSASYRAQTQVGDDHKVTIDAEQTMDSCCKNDNTESSMGVLDSCSHLKSTTNIGFNVTAISTMDHSYEFQKKDMNVVRNSPCEGSIESSQSDMGSKKALDGEDVLDNKLLDDATEISSFKTATGTFSANIEVSSSEIRRNPSIVMNAEQKKPGASISAENTSESNLSGLSTNWELDDLSLKEMDRTVVEDANCGGGDGTISSSEETLTCFVGKESSDNIIDHQKCTHLETSEPISVSKRDSRSGFHGEELDDHSGAGQVTPLTDHICSSDENSDPNFFKELLGTEDGYQFTEEIIYMTSSEQTRPYAEVQGASSVHETQPVTNQERHFYNPYLWTPMEIEVASGNAESTYAEHQLKLRSAYTDVEDCAGTKDLNREPEVTSYNRQFMGTVDYIWYSDGLQTVKVLDTIPKNVLQRTQGFPTQKWGSDHLALVCEFAFTRDCYAK